MKRKFNLLPITLTALAPAISLVGCGGDTPEPEHDYANDYLTINTLTNGYFECDINHTHLSYEVSLDLWYSINNNEWTNVEHNYVEEKKFEHKYYYHANDVIRLKGVNEYFSYVGKNTNWCTMLHFSSSVNVSGNVMSLLYGDNFKGKTDLKCDGVFYNLFNNEDMDSNSNFVQIVSAENLILPATNLTKRCYDCMFICDYGLVIPPKLPAMNLNDNCYDCMFWGCTSLTSAPYLPASTLAAYCYRGMFDGCTLLQISEQGDANKIIFTCPSEIPSYAVDGMFTDTGGTIKTNPEAGHTYYWA